MEPAWQRCGSQTLNLRYHRTTSNRHLRHRHRHLAADSTHASTTAREAQA